MPPCARRTAAFVVLTLCVAAAIGAAAEEASEAAVDTLRLEGMRFVASTGEANDAIVEAERARFVRSARVAHMSGVHARVGKSAGAASATAGGVELECERARFDLASGDLPAEGNVRGVTEDGRRFETQRLIYQHATGRVSTRSPVVIRDGFGTARGAGFEYWVRQNRFRFKGHKITPVAQVSQAMQDNTVGLRQFKEALTAMAVVVSFLVVLLAMYTTIIERTREIGILRAIGASQARVVRLVVEESVWICLAGVVVGIGLAVACRLFLPFVFPTLSITLTREWTAIAAGLGLLGGLLGSIYPAVKAARLDPVQALNFE